MRDYSNTFKEKTASINAPETPVIMLEITHPDLLDAVRVVNDNQDLISSGSTFTALAFRLTPPDDLSQGAPRAELAVDNVGRDLTAWIEASGGGEGAALGSGCGGMGSHHGVEQRIHHPRRGARHAGFP